MTAPSPAARARRDSPRAAASATLGTARAGRARWRVAVAGAAVVLAAAGCGGVESLSFRAPPRSAPTPSLTTPPTTLPDTVGDVLPTVDGVTTTTALAVTGGNAAIDGTVTGPSGPVAGATVEATRVVDGASASATAVTTATGVFAFAGLLGGDYRLRAWMAPTLAMTSPEVFFLAGGDDHHVDLALDSFTGWNVAGVFDPDPPTTGQPASLAVQATLPAVGPDGVVRDQPVAGALVELTNGPGWLVVGTNPARTGADGEAIFTVDCLTAGDQPLDASVNGNSPQSLNPPACQAPPPPPTAPLPTAPLPPAPILPTTSTTAAPAGTSTTKPRH